MSDLILCTLLSLNEFFFSSFISMSQWKAGNAILFKCLNFYNCCCDRLSLLYFFTSFIFLASNFRRIRISGWINFESLFNEATNGKICIPFYTVLYTRLETENINFERRKKKNGLFRRELLLTEPLLLEKNVVLCIPMKNCLMSSLNIL